VALPLAQFALSLLPPAQFAPHGERQHDAGAEEDADEDESQSLHGWVPRSLEID